MRTRSRHSSVNSVKSNTSNGSKTPVLPANKRRTTSGNSVNSEAAELPTTTTKTTSTALPVADESKKNSDGLLLANGLPTGATDKSEAFKNLTASATGTSFVVLLSQAILAGDYDKVSLVVTNSSPTVVLATVKDLPTIHVIPFLNILEEKFRRGYLQKPHIWMNWVQAVLSIHMNYLSSVKDVDKKLGTFSDWLTKRVSHLDKLISLNGKLEMITEQLAQRMTSQSYARQQPVFILNDDDNVDSDADDDEALFDYPDDGNNDWWGSGDEEGGSEDDEGQKKTSKKSKRKRDVSMDDDEDNLIVDGGLHTADDDDFDDALMDEDLDE